MALLCATAPWKILGLSSKGRREGNQRLSSIYSPRIEAQAWGKSRGEAEAAEVTWQERGPRCISSMPTVLFIPAGLGPPSSCSGDRVFSMLVSLGPWGRGQHVLPHSLLCSQLPNPYIGFFLETPRLLWVPALLGICSFRGGGEACACPGSSMGWRSEGKPQELVLSSHQGGPYMVGLSCKFRCPLGFSLLVSSPPPPAQH